MKIAVIDGQGGGLGKSVIERLIKKKIHEKAKIFALGTNGMATSVMIKAGAVEGASGENALIYNLKDTDIVIGSLNIIMQNSMFGEITPGMASAVLESRACKILIPLKNNKLQIMGLKEQPLPRFLEEMVQRVSELINSR